jgi:hypothetical protein
MRTLICFDGTHEHVGIPDLYFGIPLEQFQSSGLRGAIEPRETNFNYSTSIYGVDGKMKFQYTTLQPGAIRVIRFSQYCSPTFIHAWLEHIDDISNTSSRYDVISYYADPDLLSEHKSITLNGRSFMVPPALWNALSAIIAYHNRSTALWAGAISINRGDGLEEQQQLSLMPSILVCHIDRETVCCLSMPSADSYAFALGMR